MADCASPSKTGNRCTVTQNEGPRKKQLHPPGFSNPNSLVTFIIIENKDVAKEDEEKEDGEEHSRKIETEFLVHKEVACYHSPILNAAFNSEFIEGKTKVYRLEDTTARAFKLFVQWLYSQKLHVQQLQEDWVQDEGGNDDKAYEEDMALNELWILADKMSMPLLQNTAIDKIDQIRIKTGSIPTLTLHYVCTNTASDSLLRKYFVFLLVNKLDQKAFSKDPSRFPHELLIELAILHAQIQRKRRSPTMSDFYVKTNE